MRLNKVSVRKYRSIDKAADFLVDDFTVLLGPNNQGKSNLLRATVLAMQIIEGWADLPVAPRLQVPISLLNRRARRRRRVQASEIVGYDWDTDFPVFARGRVGAKQSTVIVLEFKLNGQEQVDFRAATGISINESLPIAVSLSERVAELSIPKQGPGGHKAKSREIAEFISQRLAILHIPAVRTGEAARGIIEGWLTSRRLELLEKADGGKLLAQLEAVDAQAVMEVQTQLHASMGRFLPEVTGVELQVRDLARSSQLDDILVDDGAKTSLTSKGDGIQSLVALALTLERSRTTPGSKRQLIVAVEEPESHLHPGAVRELREVLRGIADEQQVIVTTHSQALVNRSEIRHNVVVQDRTAKPAGTLSDLREALGVQLADALAANEVTVIVEGYLDELVMPRLLESLYPKTKKWFEDGKVAFESAGSGSKIYGRALAARSILTEPVVLIDGDDAGKADVEKLLREGIITSNEVIQIQRPSCAHSELEDIFVQDAYLSAVEARIGFALNDRQKGTLDLGRDKAWSERLETILAAGGNPDPKLAVRQAKYVFAESILEQIEAGASVVRPECLDLIDRLVAVVEAKFASA